MTVVNNPAGREVVVRELYPVLPDVAFERDGRFCPISVCHAPLRLVDGEWSCSDCPAHWDIRGEHGTWTDADLLAVAAAAGVVVPGTPQIVKVEPVIQPRLVLGALALLAGPGAAMYVTAPDAAGFVSRIPDGVILAAIAVIAALALLAGVSVVSAAARRQRVVR